MRPRRLRWLFAGIAAGFVGGQGDTLATLRCEFRVPSRGDWELRIWKTSRQDAANAQANAANARRIAEAEAANAANVARLDAMERRFFRP